MVGGWRPGRGAGFEARARCACGCGVFGGHFGVCAARGVGGANVTAANDSLKCVFGIHIRKWGPQRGGRAGGAILGRQPPALQPKHWRHG